MKKQINFPTAYGCQDLPLTHDFREVETLPENDRTRYTISPTARKTLLTRLLTLNHQRAAEEKSNTPVKVKNTRRIDNESELLDGLLMKNDESKN